MEKEYYTTDFEQLLKDATEDFKMYPSRRVWNSLYNNFHPAKRWPSLAVCLLLVTAILYIGVTNNNAINATSRFNSNAKVVNIENPLLAISKESPNNETVVNNNSLADKNKQLLNYEKFLTDRNRVNQLLTLNTGLNDGYISTATTDLPNQNKNASQSSSVNNSSTKGDERNDVIETNTIASISPSGIEENAAFNSLNNFSPVEQSGINADSKIAEPIKDKKLISSKAGNELSLDNTERAWVDNYAFYNRKNKNKWKAKSSLQYYITPSIGFRDIKDNSSYAPGINNSLVTSNNNGSINKDIDHQAAINLEAGAAILYSISKKIRLKGGLQFNYTNYNINAYELKHPAQTTLLLNDLNSNYYLQPFNTLYANSPALSSTKLDNKTVQLSIPLGFDYKIAGNNKIQWFAGATAQPTYILSGNAYLLSSDMKFYVNDNSFIQHWNLNTSVETFISYKTPRGIIINAGPQVRYQLFSTYGKQYAYTEKLYNFGLKMGITRNF